MSLSLRLVTLFTQVLRHGALLVLLLTLIVNGRSAHTVFHWVAGTEDTIHHHHGDCSELAFEQQHHHCNYHDYLFSPFVDVECWKYYSYLETEYNLYRHVQEAYRFNYLIHTNVRGPPACVHS